MTVWRMLCRRHFIHLQLISVRFFYFLRFHRNMNDYNFWILRSRCVRAQPTKDVLRLLRRHIPHFIWLRARHSHIYCLYTIFVYLLSHHLSGWGIVRRCDLWIKNKTKLNPKTSTHWTIFFYHPFVVPFIYDLDGAIWGDTPRVSAKLIVINHFHSKIDTSEVIVERESQAMWRRYVSSKSSLVVRVASFVELLLLTTVCRWSPEVCVCGVRRRTTTTQNHINVCD